MTGVTAKIAARRERRQEAKERAAQSVRLGPESFTPAVPDAETCEAIGLRRAPGGHTDLMVSPESIDAFMEKNPLPGPDGTDDLGQERL
jgi:hypothetical protein